MRSTTLIGNFTDDENRILSSIRGSEEGAYVGEDCSENLVCENPDGEFEEDLGCYLPGKVICLPDPKIQEYLVLPGKTIFTVFYPVKNQKVSSF